MILFSRSSMEQTLQPARNCALAQMVSLEKRKTIPGSFPALPVRRMTTGIAYLGTSALRMGGEITERSPASQSHGGRWHCAQGREVGRDRNGLPLDTRQMGRKKWIFFFFSFFFLSLQNNEFSQDLHSYLPLSSLSPTLYSLRSQLAVP